uniref:Uncharacterized protein n=1 Tax=Lygus hesperus TaxID=30085 RepID=A0A146LP68_LYGHE
MFTQLHTNDFSYLLQPNGHLYFSLLNTFLASKAQLRLLTYRIAESWDPNSICICCCNAGFTDSPSLHILGFPHGVDTAEEAVAPVLQVLQRPQVTTGAYYEDNCEQYCLIRSRFAHCNIENDCFNALERLAQRFHDVDTLCTIQKCIAYSVSPQPDTQRPTCATSCE